MSRSERDKGRRGEAEVRAILERHGFTVRGLEATGDHLAIGHGLTLHSEAKRQEVLRLPLWTRQAVAECPAGALPIVSYRRNREQWHALMREDDAGDLLRAAGYSGGIDYALREIGGAWWVWTELERLLRGLAIGAAAATPQGAL